MNINVSTISCLSFSLPIELRTNKLFEKKKNSIALYWTKNSNYRLRSSIERIHRWL